MNRRLRGAFRGNLRVWWLTHRHDVWNALALALLACAYLVASHVDEQEYKASSRDHALSCTYEVQRLNRVLDSASCIPPEGGMR
jgi:hypothetical protein